MGVGVMANTDKAQSVFSGSYGSYGESELRRAEKMKPYNLDAMEKMESGSKQDTGAIDQILQERAQEYGPGDTCLQVCRDFWNVYLQHKGSAVPLTNRDIATMMILLKLARTLSGTATKDCYDDIAGYATLVTRYCADELGV